MEKYHFEADEFPVQETVLRIKFSSIEERDENIVIVSDKEFHIPNNAKYAYALIWGDKECPFDKYCHEDAMDHNIDYMRDSYKFTLKPDYVCRASRLRTRDKSGSACAAFDIIKIKKVPRYYLQKEIG